MRIYGQFGVGSVRLFCSSAAGVAPPVVPSLAPMSCIVLASIAGPKAPDIVWHVHEQLYLSGISDAMVNVLVHACPISK